MKKSVLFTTLMIGSFMSPAVFADDSVLKKYKENFYILPSSIHEVIIVPANMNLEVKTMQRMVSDANSTVVDKRDILSEKVLFYNREKNILRVQNAEYSQ